MRRRLATALSISVAATLALLLTACGDDDDGGGAAPTTAAAATTTAAGGGTATTAGDGTGTTAGAADDTPASYPADAAAAACADGQDASPGTLDDRHRRAGLPAVRHRRRARSPGRASRPPWPTPSPARWASPRDAVSWIRTTFDGAIQPGPEGLRLQPAAVLDHARAGEGRDLQRGLLRRRTRRSSAPPTRPPRRPTLADDFRESQDRRRRRHDEPDVRPGRHPADVGPVRSSTTTRPPSRPSTPSRSTPIVVDLPTALYITRRRDGGLQVYGQFTSTASGGEPWGLLFAKDNPLARVRRRGAGDAPQGRHPRRHHRAWMTEDGDIRDHRARVSRASPRASERAAPSEPSERAGGAVSTAHAACRRSSPRPAVAATATSTASASGPSPSPSLSTAVVVVLRRAG